MVETSARVLTLVKPDTSALWVAVQRANLDFHTRPDETTGQAVIDAYDRFNTAFVGPAETVRLHAVIVARVKQELGEAA